MTLVPKIAVAAVAVVVLASCGSASTDEKTSGKSSTAPSASASASDSGSDSGSSTPSTGASSTAKPARGLAMSGTGYTYHLPKSWEDISGQLKKNQPGIDTGGRAKPTTPPFTANLNTLTTPSQISGEPTQSDLDKLATQIKGEVASLAPSIKTLPRATIAGSPAVHQEGDATSQGTKFFLIQYFAVRNGANYGVTFAFPAKTSPAEREKVVQPVLASWSWS